MARRRTSDSGTEPGTRAGVLAAGARTAVLESVAGWVPGEPVGNHPLPPGGEVDDAGGRPRPRKRSPHPARPGVAPRGR
ncbi:3-oxoacyl-ACP synthase, partial [Streptomyces anulatus]